MANLSPAELLIWAFRLLIIGALLTLLFGRRWRAAGYTAAIFMTAATLLLWLLAARTFTVGTAEVAGLALFAPLKASLSFQIDSFSAVFLLVVPFVGLAAMLYSVDYMNKVHPDESPRRYYPFALLMVAAIVGVITSSDLLFFFIFWEVMTLASWGLVWFERRDESKVRAAWVYFMATHVAAACMLIASFVIYQGSGSFAFSDVARAMASLAKTNPALVHLLMGLFLIAFATKAGMFPLGGWLPSAYPAAPSPASAMFAGSMTKMGIYGAARVFLQFLEPSHTTTIWGGIIAVLGAISICLGTFAALREDDAKRILSFDVIGQIGYVFLSLGTCLFFLKSAGILASLALMAGLYHIINYACSKGLLFLNVGAAEYAVGTRDLNRMGGLGELMPITLAAALIASLSMAGIPPLAGFPSKWLIYQSTIQGGIRSPLFLALSLVAMFMSIVTLAILMKLLGSMFLGKQAAYPSPVTGDVPASMRIPQIALSAVCVILGIVPVLPLMMLYRVARDVIGASNIGAYRDIFGPSAWGVTLRMGETVMGAWNPVYLVVAMVVCAVGAYAMRLAGRARSCEAASWYGGEEAEPDEVRYRARGFVLPFKEAFARLYPSVPVPRLPKLAAIREVLDLDGWIYQPFINAGGRMIDRVRQTHSGAPQLYMIWQIAGVIIVLVAIFAMLK